MMKPVTPRLLIFATCLLCLWLPSPMAEPVVGCQRPKLPTLPKPATLTARQVRQLEARVKVYNARMWQYINCLNHLLTNASDDLRQMYIRRSLADARLEQKKFQRVLARLRKTWQKRR